MSIFFERYIERKTKIKSLLCVGLDPDLDKIPKTYHSSSIEVGVKDFLRDIIIGTRDYAVAYKANSAFFESLGKNAMSLFADIVSLAKELAPEVLFIADAKRGDVPHSAKAYAKAFFDTLGCDALTLSPYMGIDCLEVFFSYTKKASIVLCHTSNAGAEDFQTLGNPPLYLQVAKKMAEKNEKTKNIWLVVGAQRNSSSISKIREVAPDLPFLVPGIGSQGATILESLPSLGDNVLLNVGRSILYQTTKREEVIEKAREVSEQLVEEMRLCHSKE